MIEHIVTVTILDPHETQVARAPALDWQIRRDEQAEGPVTIAQLVKVGNQPDLMREAVDDLAQAFGEGNMGRGVTISVVAA